MHEFELIIGENAELLYNVLKNEEAPRCKIKFSLSDEKLVINMKAKTISNLRAAINSFMIWIDMVNRIVKAKNI